MDPSLDALDQKILALLYLGYSQTVISKRVYVSRRTVQRRIAYLMDTLEAPGPVALGAKANEWGLLPPVATTPRQDSHNSSTIQHAEPLAT